MTAIVAVIASGNKKEEAFIIASYIVGLEVFLRMVKGAPLFETGKYSVIIVLFIGLVIGQTKQKLTLVFPIYLLLLLLGIVFTNVPAGESIRRAVAFNLSGPFALGVCAIYFYKRRVTLNEIYDALFLFILPIFSMVTFMYFRTPDFSEIAFGGGSLSKTSGGFGPNQVATVLGFGIFIIGVFIATKKRLTGFLALDALVLMYFIYRGLLTFSRGGIITAGACLVIFAFFYLVYQRDFKKIFQYIIVTAVFLTGVWVYTSGVTNGMLDNRYAGKNARGIKKADASAGRLKIFNSQLNSFTNAPLFGIGVGNGKFNRQLQGNVTAASHNEMSRLIEEHGLIGLFILVMLLTIPIAHFLKLDNFQRAILISFYFFWFLTINHSAMRIAFPGFIYALCLMDINYEEA
ncbi:MAG: O-antigen ligase family protein [Flavobacteriaceae bacterium]